MNSISQEDFGNFESYQLKVDYISFNLTRSFILDEVASYFQDFGFNCFQKVRQENKSRQQLNNQNKYELTFITDIPYWDGIQLHFTAFNANYLYKLIKEGHNFQFEKFQLILSRFDLYYTTTAKTNPTIKYKTNNFSIFLFLNFKSLTTQKIFKLKKIKKV